MTTHTVAQGETLKRIALRYGVSARRIVEDADNETLFETRGPNVLFEGDELHIPDEEPKTKTLGHDEVHTFVVRPRAQRVSLQFRRGGRPRAHEPVEWSVDGGETTAGHLDADGWFHARVPIEADALTIVLLPDTDHAQRRVVSLGHLDPQSEIRGLQQRLNNMGFHCGAEDADLARKTREALEAFQQAHGLEPTGEPDEATLEALAHRHGV